MERSLNSSRNSWAELKGLALPRRDLGGGQGEDPLISSQIKFKFGIQRDSGAQRWLTSFECSNNARETRAEHPNSKEGEIRGRTSRGWQLNNGRPPNRRPRPRIGSWTTKNEVGDGWEIRCGRLEHWAWTTRQTGVDDQEDKRGRPGERIDTPTSVFVLENPEILECLLMWNPFSLFVVSKMGCLQYAPP